MIEMEPITGMRRPSTSPISIWSSGKMFRKIWFWQLTIVRKLFRKVSKARAKQGEEQFEE
jgi:hypothetical protein